MNKSANLIMALGWCVFLASSTATQPLADANDPQDAGVQMTLTHLSVSDRTLDLSWKITNNTDHDVWICDNLSQDPSVSVFEKFLDKDGKTLVLRRRFDLPMREHLLFKYPPLSSRYVRLRAGQEKFNSVSLPVPVLPYRISAGQSANSECAGRLAVEIGFYDENLPRLILHVVEIAEKLNYDLNVGFPDSNDLRIVDRFFGGWSISNGFKNLLGFSDSVASAASGGDELNIPYMGKVLDGERVLHIEVDNLAIPYENY
ncbi:MAG: hypothetical protein JSW66_10515 [Phycisphaerales bacterium]|nr:MAG: hypothetical protein JSW66_10515 [Phycisphaerales bacterium]